jgi:ATP-dependent DNA helicase RecQ
MIVDAAALAELRSSNPDALGTARQIARFLAGITSPATTRARLTRHPLFGLLADRRFLDVLVWCRAQIEPAPR